MEEDIKKGHTVPQWEEDYLLSPWTPTSLFAEYLEMVLQFGFITIFVAAFPLAPLFALINNALEIRMDGTKIITTFRRPVAQRVKDIGIWFGIMDTISKMAILTNAVIIAFTSDFIPRTLYYYEHHTMKGYINSVFSEYNMTGISEFFYEPEIIKEYERKGITTCLYPGNRNPPGSDAPYEPNLDYWHLFSIKLVFVLAFENITAIIKMILNWLIPDVPSQLSQNIRQHEFLTQELILKEEREQAEKRALSGSTNHSH